LGRYQAVLDPFSRMLPPPIFTTKGCSIASVTATLGAKDEEELVVDLRSLTDGTRAVYGYRERFGRRAGRLA